MDDRELVKRILGGDQSAMRDLIVKYQDLVVNTCYQVLHNRHDAEDVAQEVFLEAYRSMATLRTEECLSYWLYRISFNKSINYSRKFRIFKKEFRYDPPEAASGQDGFPESVSMDENPLHVLEETEQLEVISRMMDELPVRQRKAFILHHVERLSYKEIGLVLNLSVSSVESLIFRARTTLKKRCRACYEQKSSMV